MKKLFDTKDDAAKHAKKQPIPMKNMVIESPIIGPLEDVNNLPWSVHVGTLTITKVYDVKFRRFAREMMEGGDG